MNEFSDQAGEKGPCLPGKLWLEALEKQASGVKTILEGHWAHWARAARDHLESKF